MFNAIAILLLSVGGGSVAFSRVGTSVHVENDTLEEHRDGRAKDVRIPRGCFELSRVCT